MKKTLPFLLAVIGLLAPKAHAITVDDLMQWGGYCIENFKQDRYFGTYWLSSSTDTKFEKISDTQIKLTGMFDQGLDFTFTLTEASDFDTGGTPSTNGTELILHGQTKTSSSGNYFVWPGDYDNAGDYDGYRYSYSIGRISPYEDGPIHGYKIKFDKAILLTTLASSSGTSSLQDYNAYESYELIVFEPNAWVSDERRDYNSNRLLETRKDYPAVVDIKPNGELNFYGLNKVGYLINEKNNLVPLKGTWEKKSNTQFSINLPAKQHALFAEEFDYDYWYGEYYLAGIADYFFYGWKGNSYGWLDGDMIKRSLSHTGSNRWISNGGDCKTGEGYTITFQWQYNFTSPASNNSFGSMQVTDIIDASNINVGDDYTHQVNLNFNRMGYGHINNDTDNYLYIEGDIVPGENADFVESYELYLLPGTYMAITGTAFNNSEKGHNNGFCLEGYEYEGWDKVTPTAVTIAENGNENGVIHFQRVVPESTLRANGILNANDKYTLYVKTNYTTESGLEPTFHALTTSPTTTGVEDIFVGNINDNDAPVYYYNMNGVLMDGDNLAPGLYIRRQGSVTEKVIIR